MVSGLATDLRALLGDDRVYTDPETLERYSGDALGLYRAFRSAPLLERARPDVVVRPHSPEAVAEVVRYAVRVGVPVVPVGGGTGVMGAAVPVRGGIVVDLKGLNRVVEVDRTARTVRVQAGAVLADLDRALQREGLMLGHDPWSLPIATVGGAIATNGVGYRAGRYGPMGAQVLGLEAVLPTGELLRTRPVPKPTGPDLKALFIGTEGLFGIITEAVLQAYPLPEARILKAYTFPSFEAGYSAVLEMFALDLQPAMVDFSEEFEAGTDDSETELYLAFEGPREEAEGQAQRAHRICLAHGGRDQGPEPARRFWENRHALGELYKREVMDRPAGLRRQRQFRWRMDYLHIALPASRVLDYRRRAWEVLRRRGIPVHEWSVWGRPEFFSFLIADPRPASDADGWRVMADTVDDLLALAQDLGGGMEYCHGVGIKLAHLMGRELGEGGMQTLRRLKAALDPAGVMNPGKMGL